MRSILLMIENFATKNYSLYLPLFYTIFHLILFANLLGIIPYSTTPTVEIIMTLSISLTLILGILLVGFLTHRLRLFAIFLPSGTPIGLVPLMVFLEIFGILTKAISLGLRLAINLITGHLLLKVIIGFIWSAYINGTSVFILVLPLILLTVFICLEILIAYLQAYIFTFISILTLKDISFE